jgi:hypothetical protein
VALLPVVFALAERSGRTRAETRDAAAHAAGGGVAPGEDAEAWRAGV